MWSVQCARDISTYKSNHPLIHFSSALTIKGSAEYAFDETNTSEDETPSQSGGALTDGPLSDFNFVPVGPCRQCRGVAGRTQYHAELQQLRAPTGDDNIGQSLAGALDQAVVQQLMGQQHPDHDLVNLAVAADGFQHVFGSINFRVGELLEDSQQFDMFLQCLAQSVNNLMKHLTAIKIFKSIWFWFACLIKEQGDAKITPVDFVWIAKTKQKRCIIPIRNKDNLLCKGYFLL